MKTGEIYFDENEEYLSDADSMLLLHLEKEKGSALTEAEVLSARGKAVCMMMRLSHKEALDEKRGYRDIDPENVWVEWQAFRVEDSRD
jgi:hypothetical protein